MPARRPAFALVIGAAALAAAVAAGQRWSALAQIRAISAADRARIFASAFEDLRTACVPVSKPALLADHCRQQARFVALFPECDQRCQSLASRLLPHPRR
jgi:hypothetical protein